MGVAWALAGCTSVLGDFSLGAAGDDGGTDGGLTPDGTVPMGSDGSTQDAAGSTGSDASEGGGSPEAGGGNDGSGPDGNGPPDAPPDQASPWTPTVLDQAGKLAFWLEASPANLTISGGLVEAWADQSKNHNNASNSNTGPTVDAMGINGHGALHFTTSGLVLGMTDAPSLRFAADQFYITAVAKVAAGTPYFFAKVTTGFSGGGSFYNGGLQFLSHPETTDAGAVNAPFAEINPQTGDQIDWAAPCFDDMRPHIVALRRTNSFTLALTVDDQPSLTASTGSFDVSEGPEDGAPGKDVAIGALVYGTFHPPEDFEIAEILGVHDATSGVVSDADVAQLHAYLKQKYGL